MEQWPRPCNIFMFCRWILEFRWSSVYAPDCSEHDGRCSWRDCRTALHQMERRSGINEKRKLITSSYSYIMWWSEAPSDILSFVHNKTLAYKLACVLLCIKLNFFVVMTFILASSHFIVENKHSHAVNTNCLYDMQLFWMPSGGLEFCW